MYSVPERTAGPLAEKVKGKAVLKAELYRWVAARSEKGLQYFIPLASLATTYLSSQNRQSVELHLLQLAEQARQVPLEYLYPSLHL
jgi:hypothetical protein